MSCNTYYVNCNFAVVLLSLNYMLNQNYQINQKGYNVTFWFKCGEDDRLETMLFSSRSKMLRATGDAEKRGCYAWQVTYLSTDF